MIVTVLYACGGVKPSSSTPDETFTTSATADPATTTNQTTTVPPTTTNRTTTVPPSTSAIPSSAGKVVLAEMFTGDW